ncbi:MAG: RtcB family protein [Polyangiaceae bacterium]
MSAEVRRWLPGKPPAGLDHAATRLARVPGVIGIALMPDAHVSEDVCVGTVTVTEGTIVPSAVGGDIGCGMLAVPFDLASTPLDARSASRILARLAAAVPPLKHPSASAPSLPEELLSAPLGAPALERLKEREARVELGTVGRGNHFVELQVDDASRYWLLVHSGSRALGPAIRAHHEARADAEVGGLRFFHSDGEGASRYLADAAWAGRWARLNRARIADAARDVVSETLGTGEAPGARVEVDHNHVRRELHGGAWLSVHRKGALGLDEGEIGVVPGSMGAPTFHVEGRGFAPAFRSCAHGAGRALARGVARRTITRSRLLAETRGVVFDERRADALRDEAPSAYKDIHDVMRAQRELVRIVRRLRPVLSYKAG